MLDYLHFIWSVGYSVCCRSCFPRFAVPVLHFSFFCPMLKQERRSKRRLQDINKRRLKDINDVWASKYKC